MIREYSVTERLPEHGQKCLCFGYHTTCCRLDMDDYPKWHQVTFYFEVSHYKLKKVVPEDPEETILEEYEMKEYWRSGLESLDGEIIGVTRWKELE